MSGWGNYPQGMTNMILKQYLGTKKVIGKPGFRSMTRFEEILIMTSVYIFKVMIWHSYGVNNCDLKDTNVMSCLCGCVFPTFVTTKNN